MRVRTRFNISLGTKVFVVFTMLFQSLQAQYFEFRWSEEQTYSNNRNGFFSGFINANSSYIYALNSNYAVSPLNRNKKLKLFAYDKFSMDEVASVPLKGYPENNAVKAVLASLDYFKTVVMEDRILVFWTTLINTDSTKTEELFVQSFTTDLEPENKLTKVYSVTQQVDSRQSGFALPSIVVIANSEANRVVIGSELHKPGGNNVFRHLILNSQLSASNEHLTALPVRCGEDQNGLLSGYDLGRDGNVYIRSTIPLTKEEQYLLKPNEAKSFVTLTVLNPVSADKTTLSMRGENKTITDFSYLVTPTRTRVMGFFGDLTKDPTGIDKQGIFYADIDNDSLADVQLKYAYFEKTTLSKLFPKSRGGRKKTTDQSPEEQLRTRFDIEHIFQMEDGSFVLFFTRKYNYVEITSRSGMDGRNIYKTDLYCEKNNVSAIRISDQGNIQWTSNIERSITYEGTDIADLRIIYQFNKFYVVYGTEAGAKPAGKRKKAPRFRDNLDYATFDPASGRAIKLNSQVNEPGVPKNERQSLDPTTIRVYDGKCYFHKMTIRQKPLWYVANVLVFPSIYYSVLSGNTKYAKGDVGVLYLSAKRSDKKQKRRR